MIQAARNLSADCDAAPQYPCPQPPRLRVGRARAIPQPRRNHKKKVVFLGMNPGPFGMAQSGVPFGEIAIVRDWLGINAPIGKPDCEHPKRPIVGLACTRSEVSGRRLWGYLPATYQRGLFRDHFIVNHCPLFMEETGAVNSGQVIRESTPLMTASDAHLRHVVKTLEPEWLIAVGGFAEKRATTALEGLTVRIGRILHPSPASPAANRGWANKPPRRCWIRSLVSVRPAAFISCVNCS